MKRAYNLFNVLLGILLSYRILFIYNYNSYSPLLLGIVTIFYLYSLYYYRKYKREVDQFDIFAMLSFMIFLIIMFVAGVIIQATNGEVYSLLYNSFIVLIANLIFIGYNYLK